MSLPHFGVRLASYLKVYRDKNCIIINSIVYAFGRSFLLPGYFHFRGRNIKANSYRILGIITVHFPQRCLLLCHLVVARSTIFLTRISNVLALRCIETPKLTHIEVSGSSLVQVQRSSVEASVPISSVSTASFAGPCLTNINMRPRFKRVKFTPPSTRT